MKWHIEGAVIPLKPKYGLNGAPSICFRLGGNYLVASMLPGDSHAFEEMDQSLRSVRGETHFEALRGFLGGRPAAGKHGRLVLRQCGLDVIAVPGDGQRQFGRVEHDEVGSLAGVR